MDQSHAVEGLAVGADSWLRDPAPVDLNTLSLFAHIASEEGWREGGTEGGREGRR